MGSKLKSRKFWMAVVTSLIILANEGFGLQLPEDAIMTVAGVVIAYILGESAIDAAGAKAVKKDM